MAERINRRDFIKVSGATAAIAATGLEGVLAAHRAPAFAQGTKLHWVRWVDFIPESDVELKRQMPEASKALGAEVHLVEARRCCGLPHLNSGDKGHAVEMAKTAIADGFSRTIGTMRMR